MDIIEAYREKVKKEARKLKRFAPRVLDEDDLISAGFIGLLDASRKFDPSKGASFSTYAHIRIRGAIMDELRKMDWASRPERERIKKSRENGDDTRPLEVHFLSLENVPGCEVWESQGTLESAEESLEKKELGDIVFEAIRSLPPMEKIVLALYYYHDLTLKEIGNMLGIGESRVSQIRSSAIKNMRKALKGLLYDLV